MINGARGRRTVNLQILPSAMTVLSICAGLTSIKFALEHQPIPAMALIAAAAILDGLDGRVARILDAESRMGEEIDSLADAVNFVASLVRAGKIAIPGRPAIGAERDPGGCAVVDRLAPVVDPGHLGRLARSAGWPLQPAHLRSYQQYQSHPR